MLMLMHANANLWNHVFRDAAGISRWRMDRSSALQLHRRQRRGLPADKLAIGGRGVLYGTTLTGGAGRDGTVFSLTPSPGGSWTEAILYSFGGGIGSGQAAS